MSKSSGKRLMGVRLTAEFLTPLFRGDAMLFAGLPDDITFRGLHEEPAKQSYLVVFESDEFDPVPEGKQIPVRRLVGASVDFDDPLTTSNGGRASSADENT